MAGATTDEGMVLRALRGTLRSLFEAKRYTYENASAKTGLVPSRLHTLAQGSIPVRIDNLPELLIALERLDPELLNRDLWFDRFVEEDRLRLNLDRTRISGSEREHRKGDNKDMAALIGHLDGQRFSGQAAAVGANRIRVQFFSNAFRKETIIEQPILLTIQNLTIIDAPSSAPSFRDWARLERDLDPLRHGTLTADQLAQIQQYTYELPLLQQLTKALSASERLMIAGRRPRKGLALFKGTADWKLLEKAMELTHMKEMTEKYLPATFEYCRGLCGNPNHAIDGVVILQYNTVKKELPHHLLQPDTILR